MGSVHSRLGFARGTLTRVVLPQGQWVTRSGWSGQLSQGPTWHSWSHECWVQSNSRPQLPPHVYLSSNDSWQPQRTDRVDFSQQHVWTCRYTEVGDWLIVLRPARRKIGHFRDICPSQTQNRSFRRHFPKPISWLAVAKKINLTQQKHALTSLKKCTTTWNNHKY